MKCALGDYVQAEEQITECDDETGEVVHVHAEKGAFGHIVGLPDDQDWADIYWERAGSVSTDHVCQFKRLGNADVGRYPIPMPSLPPPPPAPVYHAGVLELCGALTAEDFLERLRKWNEAARNEFLEQVK